MTFESLYRTYARDVYRFALFLSGDTVEADDITAETFARALASREPIRVSTVKAYLPSSPAWPRFTPTGCATGRSSAAE